MRFLSTDEVTTSNAFFGALLVFAGAAIAKIVDYLIARKNKSGNVRDTDAEIVFKAQQTFLQSVLDQLGISREEIAQLRKSNDRWQKDFKELELRAENWKKRVEVLEEELFDLEERLRREIRS